MSRRAARPAPATLLAALLLTVAAVAAALPVGCARETPCEFNSDCAVGYCEDGACRKNCVDASRDCPAGYLCNANAQCVPPDTSSSSTGGGGGAGSTSSSGTGGASVASSSAGTGAGPVTSSSSSSSSTSSSTSGGATKHELDLCSSDGECAAPLLCRAMVPGSGKRCTRACSSTGQCMTGTVCELIGGEHYCAGDDTGRACTVASHCNFGCLGGLYCTIECSTGYDCPNGYGCMPNGNLHICVRAEAPCFSGDTSACVGPGFCDESPQLYVGGCTTSCTAPSDCPQRAQGLPPWTCSGGLCRRPADVFGPVAGGETPAQYVNNCQGQVVNVCNDGQHIDFNAFSIPSPPSAACGAATTTDGIQTDSCLNSCLYQGGCSYGFACVAVGGVGNERIGLCLPTGGGEVGASCQFDSQCVFGYCRSGTCTRDCTADGVCPGGLSCVAGGAPTVGGQVFRRCQ